jgi:hypothetical protein
LWLLCVVTVIPSTELLFYFSLESPVSSFSGGQQDGGQLPAGQLSTSKSSQKPTTNTQHANTQDPSKN